jgi:hypothetical protein
MPAYDDVSVAELMCSNCHQRQVGNASKKCGFADWCSVCDEALWSTNPDAMSQCGPVAMAIIHDITVNETALLLARHPRQVHDVIVELSFVMFRIFDLLVNRNMQQPRDAFSLYSRVSRLIHRARVKRFNQCHAFVHRCAELVDACHMNHNNDPHPIYPLPSYRDMAEAVIAVDEVLQFLVPSMKQFYVEDLRPCLVSFMADSSSEYSDGYSSESSSSPYSSLSAGSECSASEYNSWPDAFTSALPAAKRVRWTSANTVFDYARFIE